MGISLEKRTEKAMISLVKAGERAAAQGIPIGDVGAQVKLVIDYSGSMESPENRFYSRGEMQELAERVLALSMTGLDDDGNVQVYPFHSVALDSFVVDQKNYVGAIDRWCKGPRFGRKPEMGGTDYSAVIQKIIQDCEREGALDPGKPPVFVVFQTDGISSNQYGVQQLLTAAANKPIFWQFLGLGRDTSFLDMLDTLPGRVVDNVGSFGIPQVTAVDDETFYDNLVGEFLTSWLPSARAAGIVKD